MTPQLAVIVVVVYGTGLAAGMVLAEVLGLNAAAYRLGERLGDWVRSRTATRQG